MAGVHLVNQLQIIFLKVTLSPSNLFGSNSFFSLSVLLEFELSIDLGRKIVNNTKGIKNIVEAI